MVSRHNKLRDVLAETCRRAHLGVQVEMGSNVTSNHSHTHPADLLIPNWVLGKPAAFDLSVTSSLNPTIVLEASVTTGVAAWTTEQRKHRSNDAKCNELDWVCVYHWWLNPMEPGERRLWSLYNNQLTRSQHPITKQLLIRDVTQERHPAFKQSLTMTSIRKR